MKSFAFGHTSLGLSIPAFRFGNQGKHVLILGGVHGDEIEGVWAAFGLLEKLKSDNALALELRPLLLTLVPAFNLDGVLVRERRNARGVDLNRNLPSNDWTSSVATERYHPGAAAGSEPENQALVEFLKAHNPSLIISLHSWKPMLNINGECLLEAEEIAKHTGYAIEKSIGYPTPGCLGTYAGLERAMPTITYEIERGLDRESIFKTHVPALIASLQATAHSPDTRRK